MTPEDRAKLIGRGLGAATDRLVASINTPDFPAALGDFLAEALGRVTALAAGAILTFDDRLSGVEGRVSAIEARQTATEARQRSHADKLTDINLRQNGYGEHLGKLLDRLEPGGEVDRLVQVLFTTVAKVEALEARQVGGSDGPAE